MSLLTRASDASSHREQLTKFVDLAGRLPAESTREAGRSFDPHRVPRALRPLASLVERWAISDDEERAEAIRVAPALELATLRGLVFPLRQELDAYLDTADAREAAGSEEASALSDLAQTAAEAENELLQRGESGE
jgi:hypothetical protein